MTDVPQLPSKKDVTRSFLLRGTVFLHLDPRRGGVVVPEWLRKQPQLVLQIGLDMPIPIADLRVDDTGMTGSLSFNRSPCLCAVPWDAVFAVVGEDGRGMVWPESMPAEIAAEVEREAKRNRLRDANQPDPGPASATSSAELRNRVTAPAPNAAPQVLPLISTAAPRPAERRESLARQSRKPAVAAVESQPPTKRAATTKDSSRSAKPGGKRPLPPYLRIVK